MPQILVDRRQFLALAGAAASSSLMLPQMARAEGPLVLVTTLDSDPPTMNTAVSTDIQGLIACSPAYSYLMRLDSEGKPEPDLATEWSVSDDGLRYTFKLRQGVVFHDGAPFTAADVKWTIENMISKIQPIARNAYLHLVSIETPDDHSVVITFSQANQPFLSVPYAFGPILPKHLWEGTDFTQNPHDKAPVGTGPFRFVEYRIGESLRYAKNENYHFEGQPAFDELVFRIIPDAVSRSAAFENGELDTVQGNSVPFTDLARLKALPDVVMKTNSYPGGAWMSFFNLRTDIYSNKLVRKAIAHAIDRAFIRDNVLPGIAHNMVGPLWPASRLSNTSLADYALDTDKANALLDEAGYPRGADGTRFPLRLVWQSNFTAVTRMADVITQNLKPVGIQVVLMPNETAVVNQLAHVDGEFDMIIGSYALGPDPDFGTERLYNSKNIRPVAHTNNSHYKNEIVDKLFDEQRLAPNFEARKAIYDEIQTILWDDIPMFPICAYDLVSFINGSLVKGDVFGMWNGFAESFARAVPASA
jgi:peptide/nickel transport system substrate-binding protein